MKLTDTGSPKSDPPAVCGAASTTTFIGMPTMATPFGSVAIAGVAGAKLATSAACTGGMTGASSPSSPASGSSVSGSFRQSPSGRALT